MTRWALLLATLAVAGSVCVANSGPTNHRDENDGDDGQSWPSAGATWHVGAYEAEFAALGGSAHIVGSADGSDREIGDLGGEASGRQAVTLTNTGDSVSFATLPADEGANAIVIRYSIPDAPAGGGQPATLDLSITNRRGDSVHHATLKLNSRYAWLYGGILDGVKLYNVLANAEKYGRPRQSIGPIHVYDEIQLKLDKELHAGYSIKLTKTANSLVDSITVDFLELERAPPPLPQPANYLSIADPLCGAIALDTNGTGQVFDGVDDSSYASIFNSVIGVNPFNVAGSLTQEKDYYSGDPQRDVLHDTMPNTVARGLSMFQLADHNFQSLEGCIARVLSSGGGYRGVWIPPGRFYARGFLKLPSNISIRGAGMWHSKFTAVDTAAPVPATFNGVTGIASTSGDLVFSSPSGSDSVDLADFAMFGNVTQRDSIDSKAPFGVIGIFTNSSFDHLWIEHYVVGMNQHGASKGNRITNSRVRNTLAGGIVSFDSSSDYVVENSHARSTGDDGFAIGSESIDPAQPARNNVIRHSVAQLQWIAQGFAIYGGTNNTLEFNSAFDNLTASCVQVSTNFLPAALPGTASMSAKISDMDLFRCGGNLFNFQEGALLVGVDTESLNGIELRNINISDPSYKAIDLRQIGVVGKMFTGTLANVVFRDIQVVGAPACSVVSTFMQGSVQFDNVCSCQAPEHEANVCNVSNASATTFQVSPNTCRERICRPRPVHSSTIVPPSK
jgi:hypothetical protein